MVKLESLLFSKTATEKIMHRKELKCGKIIGFVKNSNHVMARKHQQSANSFINKIDNFPTQIKRFLQNKSICSYGLLNKPKFDHPYVCSVNHRPIEKSN